MKTHQGIYLPDHEQHMLEWMDKEGEIVDGRGTYQIKKFRLAMKSVERFEFAIDIGAHVGFWTMHLADKFTKVHAFEPIVDQIECWRANMHGIDNAHLIPCALGDRDGNCDFVIPKGSSGGTHLRAIGDSLPYPLRTLDSFGYADVDFIKIDCEGYEEQVILGGEQTIRACRPCIIVEQKAWVLRDNFGVTSGQPAVALLRSWGANVVAVKSGDYVLTWDAR